MTEFMNVEVDGEEIEVVKKDDFASLEAEKTKLAEESAALKAELDKLKTGDSGDGDKEKNFSLLRKKLKETEDSRVAIEKQMGKINEQLKSFKKETTDSIKEKWIKHYAGDDAELRKKLVAEYESFAGELFKEEDIAARMQKAAKILDIKVVNTASFFGGVGVEGGARETKDTGFMETQKGKELAERALKMMRSFKQPEIKK